MPPTKDELRDLLMLNGMLNADAKDVNSKLVNDSVSKMGVRGMNPQEMLTKFVGQQKAETVIPPPNPTIKVAGIDGQFEVSAPAPLIPMQDIPQNIINTVIPPKQITQENADQQKNEQKNQQEFVFVNNLSKPLNTQEQMYESIKTIEFRINSIDARLKRIEDYIVNKKRK